MLHPRIACRLYMRDFEGERLITSGIFEPLMLEGEPELKFQRWCRCSDKQNLIYAGELLFQQKEYREWAVPIHERPGPDV